MPVATTTTSTFHRARYQRTIIAAASSANTTTSAAAKTRPTRGPDRRTTSPPPARTAPNTATSNRIKVQRQQRQQQLQQPKLEEHQQQITNSNNKTTWPPGTSDGAGTRAEVSARSTKTTATARPSEGSQVDQGQENQTHRISGPINLLSTCTPPIANSRRRHHSNVSLQAQDAASSYKGVERLNSHQQLASRGCHRQGASSSSCGSTSSSPTLETSSPTQAQLAHGLPLPRPQPRAPQSTTQQKPPLQQFHNLLQQQHEYQEVSSSDEFENLNRLVGYQQHERLVATFTAQQTSQQELPNNNNSNNEIQKPPQQPAATKLFKSKRTKPKHLAMATVRPISPQYQHTLDSAISLAKELASKNMADSGESSPKTPNSPDKKRFNFKLKHFSKSYSEASANIRDIESSISDEARMAYKSLVERGQFNSRSSSTSSCSSSLSSGSSSHHQYHSYHHQTLGGGGRSFNSRYSPNARTDYTNDDFLPPTTPPATTSKFKYSTFSVKKSFF